MTGTIEDSTRSVIERLNRSLKDTGRRRELIRAMEDLRDGGDRQLQPPSATPLSGNRAARRAARRRGA